MTRRRAIPTLALLSLLFSGFTLLELFLLWTFTRMTSLPVTILTAIVTGVIGAAMMKRQGLAVLGQARKDLGEGRFPGRALAHGVIVVIGGVLLITPGMISDVVGITTLIPQCRDLYARLLIGWAKKRFRLGGDLASWAFSTAESEKPAQPPARGDVFDAEPGSYGSTMKSPPQGTLEE